MSKVLHSSGTVVQKSSVLRMKHMLPEIIPGSATQPIKSCAIRVDNSTLHLQIKHLNLSRKKRPGIPFAKAN